MLVVSYVGFSVNLIILMFSLEQQGLLGVPPEPHRMVYILL